MTESKLREEICWFGKSIYDRGLTAGSSGNISARVDDGWLMTPTNACLGRLDPATLSKVDESGAPISGDKPTKEAFLHLSMYAQRPGAGAIVHLHSTHSVAVSVLVDIDHENPIPPLTAYYVMKIGRLALVPYYAPGDLTLANAGSAYRPKNIFALGCCVEEKQIAPRGPILIG